MDKAVQVLKNGGVIVFPTDTAVGIGCRMDEEKAVKRIFEIRKRSEDKPLLALVDSIEMAERYVNFTAKTRLLAQKYWPGGLTLILPAKKTEVPGIVRANGGSLAIRIPKHEKIIEMITKVGVPIVAPSANISGEKTPYSISEVNPEISKEADTILLGECTYKKESTIIDTTTNPWKIVREGAIVVDFE